MKAQLGECYLLNTRGLDLPDWGFAEEMIPLNRNLIVIRESNLSEDEEREPHFYIPRRCLYRDTWGIDFNDTIKLKQRS